MDRNGYIDRDEFVKAYLKLNPNVSISQLETLFMECDTNDDGVIDFDEVRLFEKSIICFYTCASCCLPLILCLVRNSIKYATYRGIEQSKCGQS